jgi:hypothetical protein
MFKGSAMPYVYKEAMKLDKLPKVGGGECVALVRLYAGAPIARTWREGSKVVGDRTLALGTAIATFDKHGKWPGKPKGNHAAFYLSQTSEFIRVIDQWNSSAKPTISMRIIKRLGKNADGSYISPSDNADAFSVIE